MSITDSLRVEHRRLRVLLEATCGWLVAGVSPGALRERAVVLAEARLALDERHHLGAAWPDGEG